MKINNLIKKNKKAQEKVVALTQILILLTSLIAVSYLISNEFEFVSASEVGEPDPKCGDLTCNGEETPTNCAQDCPKPEDEGKGTNPAEVLQTGAQTVNAVTTTQNIPNDEGRMIDGEAELNPLVTKPKVKVWDVLGEVLKNGVVGAAIGAIGWGLSYWAFKNTRFSWNMGIWMASVYTGTATAIWGLGQLGVTFAEGSFWTSTILGGLVSVPGLVFSLATAVLVLIFYREERTIEVQYICSKWEAPSGGEGQCEKCNNNANIPCTKYKCESLGDMCELLNPGESNERCAFVDRNDPSPPAISSNDIFLQDNYSYVPAKATLPSNTDSSVGVTIKYTGTDADEKGCVPYYKPLTYGIGLDKLGRCKADTVRVDKYQDMKYSLSHDTSDYNHSIVTYFVNNPSIEYSMDSLILRSGEEYETHIRCNSTSGATNLATFVFKYCVSDEPDLGTPSIKFKVPETASPIKKGETSKEIKFYLDKYSECRWDRNEIDDITQMANEMTCSQQCSTTQDGINPLYECKTTLTGLLDEKENKFYFLCKSYPGKEESLRATTSLIEYTLVGTKELVIQELTPEQDQIIRGSTQFVEVNVNVTTFGGYDEGKALCSLKNANDVSDNYQLFLTDAGASSNFHNQKLWLESGVHSYKVLCCDQGTNCDEETINFKVESDFLAPLVIRINNELRGTNQLKLTTNENAECAYSITDCTYNFEEGNKFLSEDKINHFAEWDTDNTFYVKCRDEFTNQPAPDQCSVIVRPFNPH